MDSAYDAPQIHEVSRQLGHIPLIDKHPRRDEKLKAEIKAENKRCRLVGHQIAVNSTILKNVVLLKELMPV